MKIAVLYICIGKYTVLWPEFYDSARKYLFTSDNVHYFVYTDSDCLKRQLSHLPDVTAIAERNHGWPGNTLFRFEMFLRIKQILKDFDFIYFFNANTQFLSKIDEDILPNANELVVAEHFAMKNIDPILFEYDRNKKSEAYVPYGKESTHYVQAALIGGRADAFLLMCKLCASNIEKDLQNEVVARWHDESHLNKYILDKSVKILPLSYIYPEILLSQVADGEPKILMRDKTRYASLSVLRYGKRRIWDIIFEKLEFQRRKIEKYFYWCLKHLGLLG